MAYDIQSKKHRSFKLSIRFSSSLLIESYCRFSGHSPACSLAMMLDLRARSWPCVLLRNKAATSSLTARFTPSLLLSRASIWTFQRSLRSLSGENGLKDDRSLTQTRFEQQLYWLHVTVQWITKILLEIRFNEEMRTTWGDKKGTPLCDITKRIILQKFSQTKKHDYQLIVVSSV